MELAVEVSRGEESSLAQCMRGGAAGMALWNRMELEPLEDAEVMTRQTRTLTATAVRVQPRRDSGDLASKLKRCMAGMALKQAAVDAGLRCDLVLLGVDDAAHAGLSGCTRWRGEYLQGGQYAEQASHTRDTVGTCRIHSSYYSSISIRSCSPFHLVPVWANAGRSLASHQV